MNIDDAHPTWRKKHFPIYEDLPISVREAVEDDCVEGDEFFLRLYIVHWAVATLLVSLYHGTYALGFLGGGAIVGLSYAAFKLYPGTWVSRAVNASCMMLFSALFIQQSAGRIEMHFHVFAGLAMLIRYKDLVPTLVGAGVIAVHHVVFNYCQQFGLSVMDAPIVIFDYGTGLDIVFLHAAFVVVGVVVNGHIQNTNTAQFIDAAKLAEDNRLANEAREQSLHEAEVLRAREHEQAEALREKVDRLLASVNEASTGNLAAPVDVHGDDAVGRVGSGLSGLLDDLRGSIGEIARHAETLGEASSALSAVSTQLESDAHTSSDRASEATSRVEQMDAAIQLVASSAEELAASVGEVARQAQRTDEVSEQVSNLVTRSNDVMSELSAAGQEIGKVMQMIGNIAAQTNLLALNATIEAASAGDAGRGFAVVAAEVKALAVDTGQATENVRSQVESIQARTKIAVDAMSEVQKVMADLREGSASISRAADEQRMAADQISQSAAEAAEASRGISSSMTALGSTAASTSAGAEQTRGNATQLVEMASGLRSLVQRFRLA